MKGYLKFAGICLCFMYPALGLIVLLIAIANKKGKFDKLKNEIEKSLQVKH